MVVISPTTRTNAITLGLESMAQPQDDRGTLAAEREVQAQGRGPSSSKAQPHSVRCLESRKRQIVDTRCNLAGIGEDRAAYERIHLVAILRLQSQKVAVTEAKR